MALINTLDPADFRYAAVEATRRRLAARSLAPNCGAAFAAGLSCCLPSQLDAAAILRRTRWLAVLGVIFGFGLLAAAAAILFFLSPDGETELPPSPWSEAAITCFVLGFAFLVVGGRYSNSQAYRQVSDDGAPPPAHQFPIALENAGTFRKMKAAPEDLGRIRFYPDRRCVVINGVHCHYVIFAADVVQVRPDTASASRFVVVTYKIDGEPLSLALSDPRLRDQFIRQLQFPRFELLTRMEATLLAK